MSVKEQKHRRDKAGSKRRPAKPAAENHELLGGVLQLQRLIGNQAVSNLLSGEDPRLPIQAALSPNPSPTSIAQRTAGEDELQAKPLASTITPPGQRKAAPEEEEAQNSEQTKPTGGEVQSRGVFWGSTRSASHAPNADNSRKSPWGVSQKANPANLFAKKAAKIETHSSSNTSPDIQRYETSAGFFSNKVEFESTALNATLAKALNIQQDGTDVTIGSQDYNVDGTVKASGPKDRVKEYEVGFLQTLYDSSISGYYEPDPYNPGLLQQIGTAIMPSVFGDRVKVTNIVPTPMRDGDAGEVPWYEINDAEAFDHAEDSTKSTHLYDAPQMPFPWTKDVGGVTQNLVKTRGQDVFRTWLSVQEKGTTGFFGMHRLGYIDWKVDYGTDITFNKANPAASVVTPTGDGGGQIIGINEGPGIKLPCMGDPVANDEIKEVESNW
jgi:hypothetical protein